MASRRTCLPASSRLSSPQSITAAHTNTRSIPTLITSREHGTAPHFPIHQYIGFLCQCNNAFDIQIHPKYQIESFIYTLNKRIYSKRFIDEQPALAHCSSLQQILNILTRSETIPELVSAHFTLQHTTVSKPSSLITTSI